MSNQNLIYTQVAGNTTLAEISLTRLHAAKHKGPQNILVPQRPEMFSRIITVGSMSETTQVILDHSVIDYINNFEDKFTKNIKPFGGSDEKHEEMPEWLEKAHTRIAMIEKLPENWDSYGSPPPNPDLCDLARNLLFNISDLEIDGPLFIAPVSGGFINIEMETSDRELEIELNDPYGKRATCLCVEKYPEEKVLEKSIRLDSEFRQMVEYLLGEISLSKLAA